MAGKPSEPTSPHVLDSARRDIGPDYALMLLSTEPVREALRRCGRDRAPEALIERLRQAFATSPDRCA